uniref:Neuropeptide-Like Protein n=1 Tax=Syphacia muris TaxID=451379 RepID=A0A0N5AUP9_9BILA
MYRSAVFLICIVIAAEAYPMDADDYFYTDKRAMRNALVRLGRSGMRNALVSKQFKHNRRLLQLWNISAIFDTKFYIILRLIQKSLHFNCLAKSISTYHGNILMCLIKNVLKYLLYCYIQLHKFSNIFEVFINDLLG